MCALTSPGSDKGRGTNTAPCGTPLPFPVGSLWTGAQPGAAHSQPLMNIYETLHSHGGGSRGDATLLAVFFFSLLINQCVRLNYSTINA